MLHAVRASACASLALLLALIGLANVQLVASRMPVVSPAAVLSYEIPVMQGAEDIASHGVVIGDLVDHHRHAGSVPPTPSAGADSRAQDQRPGAPVLRSHLARSPPAR